MKRHTLSGDYCRNELRPAHEHLILFNTLCYLRCCFFDQS